MRERDEVTGEKGRGGSLGSLGSLRALVHRGSWRLTEAEGHGGKTTAGGARPAELRNAEGSGAHGGWGREETRTGLNY